MTFNPLQLTPADYKKVLTYYNQPIPRSTRQTKKKAEQLLTNKLCKCIQKVKKSFRARNKTMKNKELLSSSVGVCRDSVLHRKNIDVYQFKCDKTQKLGNYPNKRFSLSKYKKSKNTTRKVSSKSKSNNVDLNEKESEVKV
jgi:hypothetical protein